MSKKEKWDWQTELVLRKPSNEEQFNANIDTSDFQISGLTIQSKILNVMGLCSKVYRSKYTTVQYSTKKAIGRYTSVFNKTFSYFEKTTPVTELYKCESLTNTAMNERFGVNVRSILMTANNWNEILKQEVLLPQVVAIVKGRYEEEGCGEDYEPSEELVRDCKLTYIHLYDFLEEQKKSGITLKKFVNRSTVYDSFFSLINDDFFKNVRSEIMDFDGNIGQLSRFIDKFLKKQDRGSVRGYSRGVMEEEVLEAQKKIASILTEEGMCFNFEGFKYYLAMYNPDVVENLETEFGLCLDEETSISTFEDLALWFYNPERMHEIRESLGVKVRARSKGEARQGVKWVIKSFNYDAKIKNLTDKIGDFNEEDATQRVKDLKYRMEQREKENNEAKLARHHASVKYRMAKKSKDPVLIERCKKEYEEMVLAATTTSKSLTATKKAYNKAKNDVDKKISAVEKVREYRERYGKLISSMRENASNEEKTLVDDMEKSVKFKVLEEDTIPYSTWTFKAYVINEDVIRVVTEELENGFSGIKGRDGTTSVVNVTSYAYLDNNKNAISEFFVDYPKGNKLFKAFEKNPNLSNVLINGISNMVKQKLGYYVDFAPEEAKWNVDMEKTLEGGNSPFDAWDF